MNHKYILLIIVLIIILIGGFLIYQHSDHNNLGNRYKLLENHFQNESSEKESANWKSYKNEKYGFAIKYPKNWFTREETKNNIGSIKEKYRLDIYYPKDTSRAKTYGSITIEFFVHQNNEKFFDQMLYMMKQDVALNIKKVTVDSADGYRGIRRRQENGIESTYFLELLLSKKSNGVFRILGWGKDLKGKEEYQKQLNLVLSSFRLLK